MDRGGRGKVAQFALVVRAFQMASGQNRAYPHAMTRETILATDHRVRYVVGERATGFVADGIVFVVSPHVVSGQTERIGHPRFVTT